MGYSPGSTILFSVTVNISWKTVTFEMKYVHLLIHIMYHCTPSKTTLIIIKNRLTVTTAGFGSACLVTITEPLFVLQWKLI